MTTTNITRRGDKGLGATAGGGNEGSFASHGRRPAVPPVSAAPELLTLTDEEIATLMDGGDVDRVYEVFRSQIVDGKAIDRELAWVDPNEMLRGERIDDYLAGDPLFEYVDDTYSDDRYSTSKERTVELLEQLGVEDPKSCVNDDVLEELSEVVRDHDTSDPLDQLVRNTHPQLMRVQVGQEPLLDSSMQKAWLASNTEGYVYDDLYSGHSERSADAREAYLTHSLATNGIDVGSFTAADREAIRELVTEGPFNWHEGVTLDAIWTGDIDSAAVNQNHGSRTIRIGGAPAHSRENSAGNTHIVLLDPYNGSGSCVALSTPVTVSLDPNRPARLDSGGSSWGYGWDDTAGVYAPAFSVAVQDVSDAKYDDSKYDRGADGRLTQMGQLSAQEDIRAELANHKRHLRQLKERKRPAGISDEEAHEWDGIHDRVTDLEAALHDTAINRGYVLQGSSEDLATRNID